MRWKHVENIVCDYFMGKMTKASGSTHADVDIITDEYAIEVKSTGKTQLRISEYTVTKTWNSAIVRGLIPLIAIYFASVSKLVLFEVIYVMHRSGSKSCVIDHKKLLDNYSVGAYILKKRKEVQWKISKENRRVIS